MVYESRLKSWMVFESTIITYVLTRVHARKRTFSNPSAMFCGHEWDVSKRRVVYNRSAFQLRRLKFQSQGLKFQSAALFIQSAGFFFSPRLWFFSPWDWKFSPRLWKACRRDRKSIAGEYPALRTSSPKGLWHPKPPARHRHLPSAHSKTTALSRKMQLFWKNIDERLGRFVSLPYFCTR